MIEPVALSTDKEDARQRRHTRNIELQWSICTYIYIYMVYCLLHVMEFLESIPFRLDSPRAQLAGLTAKESSEGKLPLQYQTLASLDFYQRLSSKSSNPWSWKLSKMVIGCFSISAEQSEYSRYSKYTGNRCFRVCELSKSCRLLILLPWHLVDFLNYERYIQKKAKLV